MEKRVHEVVRLFLSPANNRLDYHAGAKTICVICDTASGAFTVTMPDLQLAPDQTFVFYNIPSSGAGNLVTVAGTRFVYDGITSVDVAVSGTLTLISDLKGAWLDAGASGRVYNDLVMPITPKTTGAGKPTLAAFLGNINKYTFAVNDISELDTAEFLHGWVEGSAIELHVHFVTNGTNTTDRGVKFEVGITAANSLGAAYQTTFALTTISAEATIPANTPDKTLIYLSIGQYPFALGKIGAQLCMSIKRIAATGTAPTSNPFVLAVGGHYLIDGLGSNQRVTK
jgi:hypothetical protein